MTANDLAAALLANADAYLTRAIAHDVFRAENDRLWAVATAAGLVQDVAAIICR